MTWNIESFDPHTASEDELRARYDLGMVEHDELWSEDPKTPYEQWKKEMLETVSWRKRLRWAAWDEGRKTMMGASGLGLSYTETNRHLGDAACTSGPRYGAKALHSPCWRRSSKPRRPMAAPSSAAARRPTPSAPRSPPPSVPN